MNTDQNVVINFAWGGFKGRFVLGLEGWIGFLFALLLFKKKKEEKATDTVTDILWEDLSEGGHACMALELCQ